MYNVSNLVINFCFYPNPQGNHQAELIEQRIHSIKVGFFNSYFSKFVIRFLKLKFQFVFILVVYLSV